MKLQFAEPPKPKKLPIKPGVKYSSSRRGAQVTVVSANKNEVGLCLGTNSAGNTVQDFAPEDLREYARLFNEMADNLEEDDDE